jgi:hypothetical protein
MDHFRHTSNAPGSGFLVKRSFSGGSIKGPHRGLQQVQGLFRRVLRGRSDGLYRVFNLGLVYFVP